MRLSSILLTLGILFTSVHENMAQKTWIGTQKPTEELLIPTNKQFYFSMESSEAASSSAKNSAKTIELPDPEGQNQLFILTPAKTMSDKLAAKFPSIKSYIGTNTKDETARITISNKGIHAMIFSKQGLYFIDPSTAANPALYQSYYKHDLMLGNQKATFEEIEPIIADKAKFQRVANQVNSAQYELPPSGNELRTYRIAIAATGEYSQFHGGTVTSALAAIVTTLARVNGIYERELAITMVLVDNNDELIFTNASNDPFTNGNASEYIDEVQIEIDAIIGNENYDIGHGLSTGAGGLAGLGVVCLPGLKASGVTGTNNPIADPFDVDYVAHEIGHQFGGPHTFNGIAGSCAGGNRSGNTAYEPGSGVTIMAYAGICANNNIASNSIPFFHASSLQFITIYSQLNSGNSCAEVTDTGNSIPTVEAGAGGFFIPISTPFQLNGTATDADGDDLTYSWEQFDLGPAGAPNNPVGNAPLFRTFVPETDSFRIFPQLSDIVNGTQTKGEILPDYARDLSFMLTVRDDQAVGGVNNDLISFSVSDVGGPFSVDAINETVSGYESYTVNWEVANTNLSPINCSNVDIYLSDNGGQTFDYLVAKNTPNDGTHSITMPNINTTDGKVRVSASQNIFFNIAPGKLVINEVTEPTFIIAANFDESSYCREDAVDLSITSQSILGFNNSIDLSVSGLPAELIASFSDDTIVPGNGTTLTISNDNNIAGIFDFTLNSSSGEIDKITELTLTITNNPVAPTFTAPAAGIETRLAPMFEWTDANILTTYDLDIATDAEFNQIIESITDINAKSAQISMQLNSATPYFARIQAKNSCGISDYTVLEFLTAQIDCQLNTGTDLPITIGEQVNTISATIDIAAAGKVESVEVLNIKGSHSYISDLSFVLESPAGTRVTLLSTICESENNFDFSFSDLTGLSQDQIPCPPTDGQTFIPKEPLSAFFDEDLTGEWTLFVIDSEDQDGGALESWELKICAREATFPPARPSNLSVIYLGGLEIALSWEDNSDDETKFEIFRSTNELADYQFLTDVGSNVNLINTFLPNAQTTYFYKVLASNTETGSSLFSNVISVNGLEEEAIVAPSRLKASFVADKEIKLRWVDNSDNEELYMIERKLSTEASFELIDSVEANTTTFNDLLASVSATYNYRIFGKNKYVDSPYSNAIAASISVLSTNDLESAGISVYPNPVDRQLKITNSRNLKFTQITLTDLSGKQLATFNPALDYMDVQHIQAGMYILSIQSGNKIYTAQVVIL